MHVITKVGWSWPVLIRLKKTSISSVLQRWCGHSPCLPMSLHSYWYDYGCSIYPPVKTTKMKETLLFLQHSSSSTWSEPSQDIIFLVGPWTIHWLFGLYNWLQEERRPLWVQMVVFHCLWVHWWFWGQDSPSPPYRSKNYHGASTSDQWENEYYRKPYYSSTPCWPGPLGKDAFVTDVTSSSSLRCNTVRDLP